MITEKAYAKINLTLNITGKRADGYHTLDTVMQTISLHDTVTLEESNAINIDCGILSGESNIAYKAAKLFFEYSNLNAGVNITINKRIPVCAGFGGGSADGAAVLRGLNKLYKTGYSFDTLRKIALSLGADVPFLIQGGTALCHGIGEIITGIECKNDLYYVVAKGIKGASTKTMFEEIDKHNVTHKNSLSMVKSLVKGDLCGVASSIHNDFDYPCEILCPETKALKNLLLANNASASCLSGSGSGVFGIFLSEKETETVAELISKQAFAMAAKTVKAIE